MTSEPISSPGPPRPVKLLFWGVALLLIALMFSVTRWFDDDEDGQPSPNSRPPTDKTTGLSLQPVDSRDEGRSLPLSRSSALTSSVSADQDAVQARPNPSAPAPRGPQINGQRFVAAVPGAPPLPDPQGGRFDPRFEQPATRMKLFGISDEEAQQEAAVRRTRSLRQKEEAHAWAREQGELIEGTTDSGASFELMRLEDGAPVYLITNNAEARISHNVPRSQFDGEPFDYNLSGYGLTVGMWENGPPRLSHKNFTALAFGGSRAIYLDRDESTTNANVIQDHATHVLGSMIGHGHATPSARGVAWQAVARCYEWTSDDAEMLQDGASRPDGNRLYVSNHSYGAVAGWFKSKTEGWKWVGRAGDSEPRLFGLYSEGTSEMDDALWKRPYLLAFKSAGNDRGQGPGLLADVTWPTQQADGSSNPNPQTGTYGLGSGAPDEDGGDEGWDTIPLWGIAKNVLTVGNMEDAVEDGTRSIAGVEMVSSSAYGPADDGRIKPDLVGNGYQVHSSTKESDTSFDEKTGTSMASPGAAGVGLILQEHYKASTGQAMRASTLKALMIHTATDLFTAGPDYKSGWGLVNALAAVKHIDLHADEPGGRHIYEDSLSPQNSEIRLAFQADAPIVATLVWTDPAGAERSALDDRTKNLVNDLNLTLILPDGSRKRAPELDPARPGNGARFNGNDTDNVEKIGGGGQSIPAQSGTYELIIDYSGTLRDDRRQVFSLILQGNTDSGMGTVAEGLDKPERIFEQSPGSTRGFAYQSDEEARDGDRVVSFPVDHDQSAAFETQVTGPTRISFDWGVSSESNFDYLRFYEDSTMALEISGGVSTTRVFYDVSAGPHTLRWAYEKDDSQSHGDDHGWVDNLQFDSLPEAVDNLDLDFTHPPHSDAPWTLWETLGNGTVPTGDLARSADLDRFNSSVVQTQIEGPALVRFRMAQTADPEVGNLNVRWGPLLQKSLHHSVGNTWRRYSIEMPAGLHSVEWTWHKLTNSPGGGLLDELEVIPQIATRRDALNLPFEAQALRVGDLHAAPWMTESSEAAPSNDNGSSDGISLRTLFTPGAGSLNNTSIEWTMVNGPATLSFWWQATGSPQGNLRLEKRHDSGQPFVDASPATNGPRKLEPIRGGSDWQQVHLEVPPGLTELRWTYTAAPDGSEGAGWLDQIVVQENRMHPARGLDRWGSLWEFSGDAPWGTIYDASNGGLDSTTHGGVDHAESSTLATTVKGPKKLFFAWKVSSEEGFDYLRFTMDGEPVVPPISGEVDWSSVALDVPAGTHVLRWTYEKDDNTEAGSDRGWIDKVAILRPDFGISRVESLWPSALITIHKDATGGFFLDSSTDGVTWANTQPPGPAEDGSITPSVTDVKMIAKAEGPRHFFRLRFEPETVHDLEHGSFEHPNLARHFTSDTIQGWGPEDSAGRTQVRATFGFAAHGDQHALLRPGAFLGMDQSFLTYSRGVHSITAAIGHRASETTPGTLSSLILIHGLDVGRIDTAPATLPSETWTDSFPVSWDQFDHDTNAISGFQIRLESSEGPSLFDHVRAVYEPQ